MPSINEIIKKYYLQFEEHFKHRRDNRFDLAIANYNHLCKDAQSAADTAGWTADVLQQIEAVKEAYVGDSLRAWNQPAAAKEHFERAINAAEHPLARAVTLEFLTIYETQYGNREQSIKFGEEAAECFKNAGHPEKVARMHSVLGSAYIGKATDEINRPVSAEYSAEAKQNAIKGTLAEARKHFGSAIDTVEILKTSGQHDKKKIMPIEADAFHRSGEASILLGLHATKSKSLERSLYNMAVIKFDLSIEIYTELGDEGRAAVVYGRKAHALSLLDRPEECIEAYKVYIDGIARDIIQPAAISLMLPYVNEVKAYLTRKGFKGE